MAINPVESPAEVPDAETLRRGRSTLARLVAAVLLWLIAITWAAIGLMATLGASPCVDKQLPYAYFATLVAMFMLPALGFELMGAGSWRASWRLVIFGTAAFAPLVALIILRAFFGMHA